MVETTLIKDVLLDIPYISNISVEEKTVYSGVTYSHVVRCDLLINGKVFKLILGIPISWNRDLINIYVQNYISFPYMPHVEPSGKMCLFDLEGVLIDANFEGILEQCISRAKEILENGLYKDNTHEFVREFSSYWCYLKGTRRMKFAVPYNQKTQLIRFCESDIMRENKEKDVTYIRRCKKSVLFGAADLKYFSAWGISGQHKNGLFIYLEVSQYILPPDPREELTLDYVQMLLADVPNYEIMDIVSKLYRDLVIVFEIKEPENEIICFGVLIKNAKIIVQNEKVRIVENKKINLIPLDVWRIDENFLRQRTTQEHKLQQSPNCLLIGCGSIGGYLCSELIKSGWKNITLVDKDILQEENIYRHFLGIEYVGQYKAEALIKYFEKNLPPLNLIATDGIIEELIEDESIMLNDYDVIISATGNHNTNRFLNNWLITNNINRPCFYLWNEPLDVGCHLAIISADKRGSYECFFDRNPESNELYDVTAYTEPGQIVTKNFRGCGGSFIPYASNVSLKVVISCIEWIDRFFSGRCRENLLVSIKGDAYYFKKAGLKCSKMYMQQQQTEKVLEIVSLLMDNGYVE